MQKGIKHLALSAYAEGAYAESSYATFGIWRLLLMALLAFGAFGI